MINFKSNYGYVTIILVLCFFVLRLFYGGYGGHHMPMGINHGITTNQNYVYIAMGFFILMFLIRYYIRKR